MPPMPSTMDTPPSPREPGQPLPTPSVRKRRLPSVIWLIPLVAVLLGGYLVYLNWSQRGPQIELTFQQANGLEAGKTRIRYKDVDVGLVESVELGEDLRHIVVTAQMH